MKASWCDYFKEKCIIAQKKCKHLKLPGKYAKCHDCVYCSVQEVNDTINDTVNHPKHYTSHPSGIECIQVTQHYDFCIGNAIKYLWRAGIKNQDATVEDLKKAIWYINKKIEMLEKHDES